MNLKLLRTTIALAGVSACATAADPALDLAGEWQVQLRPGARAVAWDPSLPEQRVQLPGSIQAQGIGEEVSVKTKWTGGIVDKSWYNSPIYEKYRQPGNVKIPFWLQPERHFIGNATFRREIDIPAAWDGKRVVLSLERVHINSRVWLDGKPIGTDNSLSTPHRFDLGHVAPGKHTLAIGVDNQFPAAVGENSHCVSDHMQTNWTGAVGSIQLDATPDVWIDGVETYPDVASKQVTVKWRLGGKPPVGKIACAVRSPDGKTIVAEADAAAGQLTIPLGDAVQTWDEFSPQCHRLATTLTLPNGGTHTASTVFGMVNYTIEGRHFRVNGRPTIFRGTLDCAMFPMTGYPSTDIDYWKKEIAIIKEHGFNHIRFHSWCPPEAAFTAADELGCYLQVEHAWTNPASAGAYLMSEAERIIRAYGNHPSFAMHTYGNEPSGGREWMENFAAHFAKRDPRHFYATSSGREALKNDQYFLPQGNDIRVNSWGAGLSSELNARAPQTMADFGGKTRASNRPIICHEAGQWCVYPDFTEIPKYTGFLKAKNFEIFRDFLAANHMADQARDFLMASGRLQTLCYKHEIEKLLRTPDIGGYQLLGLNDFPGQGTALVGAVNPFWETKPYTTPAEYAAFAGPSVPLARLPKFVFTTAETLTASLEISHYAAKPFPLAVPTWKIAATNGKTLAEGRLPARDIPVGQSVLGKIEVPLNAIPTPSQVKLVVGIADSAIENHWDLWIYPAATPKSATDGLVITHNPQEALQQAQDGASVLLLPAPTAIVDPEGPKVVFGFSSIFWNTAWTGRQPPTTLGILCNPKHTAFAQFPTEYHSNYQWWHLTKLAPKPFSLQGQAPELRPIVQVIDDWFTARRLGLLVEANHGKGKLLICAVDFDKAKPDDIVAAQLRASLIAYMKSADFAPQISLDETQLAKIVKLSATNKLIGKIDASSENADHPATNAIDGDPETIWHTEWQGSAPSYPHEIRLTLANPAKLSGIRLLPRQDGNANGRVKDIEVQTSADGTTWKTLATETLPNNREWKNVAFPAATAKFLKLRALSPQKPGEKLASFAEVVPEISQ